VAETIKASVPEIAEVVGCRQENPPGNWMLTEAGDPMMSETQSTSSVDLKAAQAKPLGHRRYRLLGVGVFNALSHNTEKVAVKGILIQDSKENRLNVTSLQMVAPPCMK
jgi:hypothetical protein